MSSYQQSSPSRRNVVKGAAWAAPVIGVGVAAPTIAASLRIDPGINGWVQQFKSRQIGTCAWTVRTTSQGQGQTPDGAPFGLYIYDTEDVVTITNAKITYWIPGNRGAGDVTWTRNSATGLCWNGPTRGGSTTKTDNRVYTPYTWTYNCTIDPSAVSGDGRLYLQDLDVTAKFTQPLNQCDTMNTWAQRAITIDGELFTFERRAGTDPSLPGGTGRRASSADGDGVSAL